MAKAFVGVRLQRLREERRITQAALAKSLGISASYLNQIERNQRPLTVPVLLRLNAAFGVDVQFFSEDEEGALAADLREILAELGTESVSVAETRALAANMPGIARSVIELHRRGRVAVERGDLLVSRLGEAPELDGFAPIGAHDEVRDFLNRRRNHIPELDTAAESLFQDCGLVLGHSGPGLAARLAERHLVHVAIARGDGAPRDKRHFDPVGRLLHLPEHLRPAQLAFQMAAQLCLLEQGALLDALVDSEDFSGPDARRLARVGLVNYFAGAVVMPYGRFLQSAEEFSYDIERLSARFGAGFEAVCHRLSTLQRPGMPGLPFFFVRVDRAGNVSKRHSASDFHFSRVGGTCPLWIVYEAFSQPGRILTQIAGMPDGRTYFWVARQVTTDAGGYGRPRKTFAIGLGCDIRHAHRLVYSRGLDLSDPAAATPIGASCKVCERRECSQRAFPQISRPLAIDENRSRFEPYPVK